MTQPLAFPRQVDVGGPGEGGMTLQDWFAGMALIGVLSSTPTGFKFSGHAEAAACCYDIANAMMKERAKEDE